jgi:hypothetical protein
MSPEDSQLVRQVFDEALERPEAERTAFLESACTGRPDVLRQVKELLAARSEAGDFLERKPESPRYIGRYMIKGELGRGAMGVVYDAVDPLIGRAVAIKIINLQPVSGVDSAFLRDRLFREARSAGMLFHPGIAVILDVGQEGDLAFIAMERVDGPSLFQVLERDRHMERAKAVSILRQTAAALDFAHAKDVVHRDIKPANIMLEKGVTVKVADFGIAKITTAQQHTMTGLIMGTPSYMSPEQVDGKPLDGRSDQFSLAVVGYELLTGSRPFQADTVTLLVHNIVFGARPSASAANPELPATVDAVFHKALARVSAERYASCGEFVDALDQALLAPVVAVPPALQAPAPPRRRYGLVGAAAVILLLVLAGVGYYFRSTTTARPGPVQKAAPAPVPVIARFAASPNAVEPGASAMLRWETSGASTLTITPDIGKVAAQDSLLVRPSQTTSYVLTATNSSGTVTAQAQVQVGAATVAPAPTTPADDSARAKQFYVDATAKRRAGQFGQAMVLLRQAADLGEPRAMVELGEYDLEDTDGGPRNAADALRWFKKAAGTGDMTAMLHLGACYDVGIGVAEDDEMAVSWYRKAADKGSSAALFDLGKMYESGRGVARDAAKAREFYSRAAKMGNAEAKSRLAHLR